VVDDISYDSLHDNKLVAVYAATVRKEGRIDGKVIGVLGVILIGKINPKLLFRKSLHYLKRHGSAAV